MREKNYNTGLRGVLFEAKHYERMGAAIWLYGWLVLRQTHQSGSVGWVLGGAPIHYCEIQAETGFAPKTLERWMRTLRERGYIETQTTQRGLVVRILKAKKFAQRFPQASPKNEAQPPKLEVGAPQKCGEPRAEFSLNQSLPGGIGSSFLEESKIKDLRSLISTEVRKQIEKQNANPFCSERSKKQFANESSHSRFQDPDGSPAFAGGDRSSDPTKELRLTKREFLELIRAEREDSVRRELHVGTGPEVPRG